MTTSSTNININKLRLCDFGTAVHLPNENDLCKIYTGSPQYMAPEVIELLDDTEGTKGYSFPADMWSVGVILYILICQGMPFSDDVEGGAEEMRNNIKNGIYSMDACDKFQRTATSRDLIRRLLNTDAKARFTVKQALNHMWFRTKAPGRLRGRRRYRG